MQWHSKILPVPHKMSIDGAYTVITIIALNPLSSVTVIPYNPRPSFTVLRSSVQKHWSITSSVILSESVMHDENKKKMENRERGQYFMNINIWLSLINPKSLQCFPNPTCGVNPFVEAFCPFTIMPLFVLVHRK